MWGKTKVLSKQGTFTVFHNMWHSSQENALMIANACTKADTCFHRRCLILSHQFEKLSAFP